MTPGNILKRVNDFLNLTHFKTITGALAWALATAAISFITAVGVVFISSVRPNPNIVDLVRTAEYAVAVVLALFFPIVALIGAAFVCCVIAVSLYRVFARLTKRGEPQKPKAEAPVHDKTGAVIPFNHKKTATS